MTVIVANDTPPSIRGMLKRWFIEPHPNVFVGTVNRRIRNHLLEYIRRNAPRLGLLVIADERNAQGFHITSFGQTHRRIGEHTGLQLIVERWTEADPDNPDDLNDPPA